MTKILVLETGTQGLAMVHALNHAGYIVYLLYGDKNNYAARSRYVDKKIRCEISSKDDSYIDFLIDIIKRESIDVIIPMSDASAHALSKHKQQLKGIVSYKMPDYDDFMHGYDKNQLMSLCKRKGYPHPQTLDLSNILDMNADELQHFPFPAMLKPNLTTGGRGMVKVDNLDESKELFPSLRKKYGDYHLQRFIAPGGKQIKVQLYINEDKSLRAATMLEKKRWYPVQGGSNCCAVSIFDQSTIDMCYNILKDLNWIGFADFDLIEDPKTRDMLVMEINPRVPACIKSPIAAGVNWAKVIVEGYLDQPITDFQYRENVILRHLGLDVLWFIKSPMRWHTKPNWFKFFGKDVYYQDMSDWSDPMPFIAGTWRNVISILTGHGKGKV